MPGRAAHRASMNIDPRLAELLERDTVIHVANNASYSARAAIRDGSLKSVLPGLYARADLAADARTRMIALHRKDPNVVFTELSAAGLLWDPKLLPTTVTATGHLRCRHRGYCVSRRTIDPEFVASVQTFRCTDASLTAVDLIPDHGGDYVDRVLRLAGGRGARVLDRMWSAYHAHPKRPGNALRHAVLRESRDLPWSEAERRAHTDLRTAGVAGWRTNFPVILGSETYVIDIAFLGVPLAIEIDGWEFHSSREAFERDRERQNALCRRPRETEQRRS